MSEWMVTCIYLLMMITLSCLADYKTCALNCSVTVSIHLLRASFIHGSAFYSVNQD